MHQQQLNILISYYESPSKLLLPLPPKSVYNSSKSVHIRTNDSTDTRRMNIIKNQAIPQIFKTVIIRLTRTQNSKRPSLVKQNRVLSAKTWLCFTQTSRQMTVWFSAFDSLSNWSRGTYLPRPFTFLKAYIRQRKMHDCGYGNFPFRYLFNLL